MNSKLGWFLGALAAGLVMLAGCGTQTAGGVAVEGKLLDLCGQPLPYNTVYVPGTEPILTDAQGNFTIEGVKVPYDLVVNNAYVSDVADGADATIVVFRGLTRTDPYLVVHPIGGSSCAEATVQGSLSPASPTDIDTAEAVAAMLGNYQDVDYDNDTYSLALGFDPATAGDATLLALRWQVDADGNAAAFSDPTRDDLGAVAAGVAVEDGTSASKDLTLGTDVGTRTFDVAYRLPSVMSLSSVQHFVTYAGEATPIRTARFSFKGTPPDTLSFAGPTGMELGSLVRATAGYGDLGRLLSLDSTGALDLSSVGGEVEVWQQVAEGTDQVTLQFPDPVVPIAPNFGSVITPGDTVFRWVGPEGLLYDVVFGLYSYDTGMEYAVEVITGDQEVTIPSYEDLGGLVQTNGEAYWMIEAAKGDGLPATMDELASADGAQALVALAMGSGFPGSEGYRFSAFAGWYVLPGTQVP